MYLYYYCISRRISIQENFLSMENDIKYIQIYRKMNLSEVSLNTNPYNLPFIFAIVHMACI